MRRNLPNNIQNLLRSITVINGISTARAKLFSKVIKGDRIIDLLLTLPDAITDRTYRPSIQSLQAGKIATIRGVVTHTQEGLFRRRKHLSKVTLAGGQNCLSLSLFTPWQIKVAQKDCDIAISGKIKSQSIHHFVMQPVDYCLKGSQMDKIPYLDPKWPLTAGLFHSQMMKAIHYGLKCLPRSIPEWHDIATVKKQQWPDFVTALLWIQNPDLILRDRYKDKEKWQDYRGRAKERLACDELLCEQLSMRIAQVSTRQKKGCVITCDEKLIHQALKTFGYPLTAGQREVWQQIRTDLGASYKMNRLIQGDVGSGKTLLALLAMLNTVEAGYQAALMVPTEILARQHAKKCQEISPVPVTLLCSSLKDSEKRKIRKAIASGEAKIIIGTQALIQKSVSFYKLGLAIIDEQHRFGVAQRLSLTEKGQDVNVLGMTATPIPRTLLLTRFGHMQTSFLKDKPQGRKPISTSVHSLAQLEDVFKGLKRILQNGAQIFWVCPLVDENDDLEIAAATKRYEELTAYFGPCIGLTHGQQDPQIRKEEIDKFTKGETSILVATTVIEVGVDVPSANVMIIEHAERFGLSQLHQLRGRVGRGNKQSYCLLLYGEGAGKIAKQRLSCLRQTEDGFSIANEDFRLRGSGDATGYKQSGMKDYRFSKDGIDIDMLETASREAQEIARKYDLIHKNDILGALPPGPLALLALFSQADASHIFDSG